MSDEKSKKGIGHMTLKALDLLRQHPDGLTMSQMREKLNATAENQEHFNRRVRDIRKLHHLHRERVDGDTVYKLGEAKPEPADFGQISEKLRAAVLHAAHGRCQMCGKTVKEDGVKLQVDHRIPGSWGGPTEFENLQALCEECNRGKRNFFSSFDGDEMRNIIAYESVHERLAHLLKLRIGEPVPAYILDFVANVIDRQEDWHKRLRELRYPGIDLVIEVSKKKNEKGVVQSFYTLKNWKDLPPDHKRIMRDHEKRTKAANSDED
jgi:hypothetical protein